MRDKGSELTQQLEAERTALESLLSEQARLATRVAEQRGRVGMVQDLLRRSRLPSRRPRQSDASGGAAGLKEGSRLERAHAYLREEGTARHVRDILLALGEEDSPNKRNGLASQLNRCVEAGRHFVRDETKGRRYFGAVAGGDPGETAV